MCMLECNLFKSFLFIMFDEYCYVFGDNFDIFMFYWDNWEVVEEIEVMFEVFQCVKDLGYWLGLFGICYLEVYVKVNEVYGFDFCI